jgi:hypothetical protein
MTSDTDDFAGRFADAWRLTTGIKPEPTLFWPCCRILAGSGLLVAQEEQLAAVALGPFHLAVTPAPEPVRNFIEVLFPAIVSTVPSGETVAGAVSGVLSGACVCFVQLLRRGMTFGREPEDQLRWKILVHIRNQNKNQVRPSPEDVIATFSERNDINSSTEDIGHALAWLMSQATPIPLVKEEDDGLECLV